MLSISYEGIDAFDTGFAEVRGTLAQIRQTAVNEDVGFQRVLTVPVAEFREPT